MIIAVDGPAGAGKGTLAKQVASHFNMAYLDTGALYRGVAVATLKAGGNPQDEASAAHAARHLNFDFRDMGSGVFHAFVDGQDVETELRAPDVGTAASHVSAMPSVRQALKEFQVTFAEYNRDPNGVILDGRDIGTVICPEADLKLFLEADARVRAQRRLKQLQDAGEDATFDEVYAQTVARDERDRGRQDAPLRPAEDALIVDSSKMDAEQVFEYVKALVEDAQPQSSSFQTV